MTTSWTHTAAHAWLHMHGYDLSNCECCGADGIVVTRLGGAFLPLSGRCCKPCCLLLSHPLSDGIRLPLGPGSSEAPFCSSARSGPRFSEPFRKSISSKTMIREDAHNE